MSKEGSPGLTKSWVFIDPDKKLNEDSETSKDTSGVQEVTENEPHLDSDTDSISVISESGCSYRTDEEELTPTAKLLEEEKASSNKLEIAKNETKIIKNEIETVESEPEIVDPQTPVTLDENTGIDKLLYFATSAVCAVILLGFSVAVQQYLRGSSDVHNFESEQELVFSHVQNAKIVENSPRKIYSLKKKSHFKLEELENKVAKLQEDSEIHHKVALPIQSNDLQVEENFKSNYKLNKNKNPALKCNKENCDTRVKTHNHERILADEANIHEKKSKNEKDTSSESPPNDETYVKKIKELKVKEDFLKEKEKFLIEKEHHLLKKELKLNQKQYCEKNKHDKKIHYKEGKEHKDDSEEESGEKKSKFQPNQAHSKEYTNPKINKKHKYKEETRKYSAQKGHKVSNEQYKKRNISGQWYINLHEARDSLRQKKRAGFKRNKAHWYFQWMVDRARLRVK